MEGAGQPPVDFFISRAGADAAFAFGFAVLARQVFAGEKRDNPGAGSERRVHPLHEVAVGEVPLLQDDALAAVLQNAPDFAGIVLAAVEPRRHKPDGSPVGA